MPEYAWKASPWARETSKRTPIKQDWECHRRNAYMNLVPPFLPKTLSLSSMYRRHPHLTWSYAFSTIHTFIYYQVSTPNQGYDIPLQKHSMSYTPIDTTHFRQFASTIAKTLYNLPTQLVGQISLIFLAPIFLEILAMNNTLILLSFW